MVSRHLRHYAAGRITRRAVRAVPLLGSIVALATLAASVRRKGWIGGVADTVLDVIPIVGGAKAVAEIVRGRDVVPDRSAI